MTTLQEEERNNVAKDDLRAFILIFQPSIFTDAISIKVDITRKFPIHEII